MTKQDRDWDSPEYKEYRRKVRKRDGSTCQMPNCNSRKAIKVHHILPWAKYPLLRYDPSNGICLCRVCHDSICRKEMYYANLFLAIAKRNGKK